MNLLQKLLRSPTQKLVSSSFLRGGKRLSVAGESYYGETAVNNIPQPPKSQRYVSYFLGTFLWLWIFYRAKQDGPVAFGFEKPHYMHPIGDPSNDDLN